MILETESGITSSHCTEFLLWKRLCTSRRTDFLINEWYLEQYLVSYKCRGQYKNICGGHSAQLSLTLSCEYARWKEHAGSLPWFRRLVVCLLARTFLFCLCPVHVGFVVDRALRFFLDSIFLPTVYTRQFIYHRRYTSVTVNSVV